MTWTTFTTELDPDQPARSVDIKAINENITAQANGDSGAPKNNPSSSIDWASSTGTSDEGDWVLNRIAEASDYDRLGTYAMLHHTSSGGTELLGPGQTKAGSELYPASVDGVVSPLAGQTPSGSWRCMGHSEDGISDERSTTIWVRIA